MAKPATRFPFRSRWWNRPAHKNLPAEVLSPVHRDALVDFLTAASHLPRSAPFVDPRLMSWKYDEPRPDWRCSRSYAWMEDGQIAAHACVCPVTYRVGDREIRASYLIDWAAGRKSAGAGVLLLRKLASSFEVLLAIGGSADTRQILPKLGYRLAGELAIFVQVLRPWQQFRTDPDHRRWKAGLRMARNVVWSRGRTPAIPAEWSCTPVTSFDSRRAPLLRAGSGFPGTVRTPELMRYWLRCPGAAMSAFVVENGAGASGWFVLARVGGVIRIADLRIDSADPEHWRAAFACAILAAQTDEQGCELIAAASTPLAQQAARQSGFQFDHTEPVYLLDPRNLLIEHAPLEIAMIESDRAYLYDRDHPYLR